MSDPELARLRWRCRRGMRELDLLMEGWLTRHYQAAPAAQQAAFRRLLETPDPELLRWLTGRAQPDDTRLAAVVDAIRTQA